VRALPGGGGMLRSVPTMRRQVPLLTGVAFLLASAVGGLVVWQAEQAWQRDRRELVGKAAAGAAFALEQQVSRALSATYTLSALVQHDEEVADFDRLAAQLLPAFAGVASLQLAPGGVVARIHPLAGNEAALGHDLLADPDRRFQAMEAVTSRRLTVAGPFELRQGGMGLVGRLAIYLPVPGAAGGERFWGLVTALIRLPPLLEAAQIGRLDEAGYAWQLSHPEAERGRRGCFARCDQPLADPAVEFPVEVPNGAWTLSVAPRGGWPRPGWLLPAWLAVLAAALGLAALGWLVLRQPERLQREVALRTDQLARANAALASEVAERSRAELALRVSEEMFRVAFRTSPEPLTLTRLDDGMVVAVNDGFLELHGLKDEEVVGHRMGDLGLWIDPRERTDLMAELEATGAVRGRDIRLRAAGGVTCVLSYSAGVVVLGGVKHALAMGLDVTKERATVAALQRVTAELRQSEARYRFAMRSMPVVQWAIDQDGRFTLSEGQGLAALGLRAGEVVGRSVGEVYAAFPEVIAAYERALAGQSFQLQIDFSAVVFDSHWAPLRDDAGRVVGVAGVALDVTGRRREEGARKEAEARLALMERLAATGRLAAGVAHEINNPLTYVQGNLEVLLEQRGGAADPATLGLLREALAGARRVRDIVRDLRTFARGGDDAVGACDPAAAARAALDITGNELRHRARLVTRFDPAPRAGIPERRLTQVLVNLLVNACRAIPEGGDGPKEIRVTVREAGGGAVVEVADSGVGMTPEVRARVFEPFFTTRDVGEGMGLGLALSRAMVAEAGGDIEVESEPGRGSLFRVRLPAAQPEAARPADAAPPAGPAPAAPARPLQVLVVDDEPMVARAVARALRRHRVEVVGSAAEALARLAAGPPPDAIVCDLMMPEVTGMDLHDRLGAERPELARRMVFLTGGAFTDRARAFVERHHGRVVEKPVDGAELLGLVEAVARPAGAG